MLNVLHFYADENVPGLGRPEAIDQLINDVQTNWQQHMLNPFADNYTYEGVRWTDLHTEEGLTGEEAPLTGMSVEGQSSGAVVPPNVAVLVKKIVEGGRSVRAGRLYLPPPGEAYAEENGELTVLGRAGYQTELDQFLDNTQAGGGAELVYRYMVTVTWPRLADGSVDPDGVGVPHRVTGLLVDPIVATQRRRLR